MKSEELSNKVEENQDKETSIGQPVTRLDQENDVEKTQVPEEFEVSPEEEAKKISAAQLEAARFYEDAKKRSKFYDAKPADEDAFEEADLNMAAAEKVKDFPKEVIEKTLGDLEKHFADFKKKLQQEGRYAHIAGTHSGRLRASEDLYDSNTFIKFEKKIALYKEALASKEKKQKEGVMGFMKKLFGNGK